MGRPAGPRRPHDALAGALAGGLTLKALMGVVEGTLGLVLALAPAGRIEALLARIDRWRVIEDLHGGMVRRLLHSAEVLPPGVQHFYAFYLTLHGVLKLAMVGMLWARLRIAWPAAVTIEALFIGVGLDRFAQTRNPVLAGLAALDVAILLLLLREWRRASATNA